MGSREVRHNQATERQRMYAISASLLVNVIINKYDCVNNTAVAKSPQDVPAKETRRADETLGDS